MFHPFSGSSHLIIGQFEPCGKSELNVYQCEGPQPYDPGGNLSVKMS